MTKFSRFCISWVFSALLLCLFHIFIRLSNFILLCQITYFSIGLDETSFFWLDLNLFFTFRCSCSIFLGKGKKENSRDEEARLLLTSYFVLYVNLK